MQRKVFYLHWGQETANHVKSWMPPFRVYRELVGTLEGGHANVRHTLDLMIRDGQNGQVLVLVGDVGDATFPTMGLVMSPEFPNFNVAQDELAMWWARLMLRVERKVDMHYRVGGLGQIYSLDLSRIFYQRQGEGRKYWDPRYWEGRWPAMGEPHRGYPPHRVAPPGDGVFPLPPPNSGTGVRGR